MSRNITIYTDGGCIPNPGGKGGAGAVILENEKVIAEICKSYYPTTNNRMEVTAAILALQSIPTDCNVVLYSDSQYVVKTMNGEFSMSKNTDLWAKLKKEVRKQTHVAFKWIRGHNGNKYNERCDELASAAINQKEYEKDQGFGGSAKPIESFILADIPNSSRPIPTEGLKPGVEAAIKRFISLDKPSFKDYKNLKTNGQDAFSRLKINEIEKLVGKEIVEIVNDALPYEKDAIKALKWYLRGLPLHDCVHKVKVDQEITANAISRY